MGIVGILGVSPPALLAILAEEPQPLTDAEVFKVLLFLFLVLIGVLAFLLASAIEKALRRKTNAKWNAWVKEVAPEMDPRIKEALRLEMETDNHSDAWYAEAVRLRRDDIIRRAPETREGEAGRRLKNKLLEQEYDEVAAFAARRYGHDKEKIKELLRKADQLPYRLLEEAMQLAQSEDSARQRSSAA